jgi:hypothetical protein
MLIRQYKSVAKFMYDNDLSKYTNRLIELVSCKFNIDNLHRDIKIQALNELISEL